MKIEKIKNLTLFLFIIWKVSISYSQQELMGKLTLFERSNEPLKEAQIIIENRYNSIIEEKISDGNGVFNVSADTSLIGRIILFHPLVDSFVIYQRDAVPLSLKDSILYYELPLFDYRISKEGESIIYNDVEAFINTKNSTYLDLKDEKLTFVPNLEAIQKHGSKAIFLEDNLISSLSKKVFKIRNLSYLDLSGNPLDSSSIRLIKKMRKRKKNRVMIIY